MTTTESTTGERIVVLPEVTISAATREAADRAHRMLDKLVPEMQALHSAAMEVQAAYDQALVTLYPYVGTGTDEVLELASMATGWDALRVRLAEEIGDKFTGDILWGGGLTMAEVARGGELNIARGTFALIDDPAGVPVRVMVARKPAAVDEHYYTVVNADDLATCYTCDHAELKAGVEAEQAAQEVKA